MSEKEKAAYTAVCNLMHKYRALYYGEKVEKPMDENRVKEILQLPSSELVKLCMSIANLTTWETQTINYCVRLGYTQEETAEIMDCSRNYVQKQYRSAIGKLLQAWSGVFWIQKL